MRLIILVEERFDKKARRKLHASYKDVFAFLYIVSSEKLQVLVKNYLVAFSEPLAKKLLNFKVLTLGSIIIFSVGRL